MPLKKIQEFLQYRTPPSKEPFTFTESRVTPSFQGWEKLKMMWGYFYLGHSWQYTMFRILKWILLTVESIILVKLQCRRAEHYIFAKIVCYLYAFDSNYYHWVYPIKYHFGRKRFPFILKKIYSSLLNRCIYHIQEQCFELYTQWA